MNEIATSILSTLEETDAWITSSEIAHRLNLSTRTIKKYIAELNEEAENLIEASRKGYKLNKDCLAQFRSQLLTHRHRKNVFTISSFAYYLKSIVLSFLPMN